MSVRQLEIEQPGLGRGRPTWKTRSRTLPVVDLGWQDSGQGTRFPLTASVSRERNGRSGSWGKSAVCPYVSDPPTAGHFRLTPKKSQVLVQTRRGSRLSTRKIFRNENGGRTTRDGQGYDRTTSVMCAQFDVWPSRPPFDKKHPNQISFFRVRNQPF